jgi:hypothetical protein
MLFVCQQRGIVANKQFVRFYNTLQYLSLIFKNRSPLFNKGFYSFLSALGIIERIEDVPLVSNSL